MIRFIDLRDQIIEGIDEFAWFDTVVDEFLNFADTQTWESWEDFVEDYNYAPTTYEFDRFVHLFPKDRL